MKIHSLNCATFCPIGLSRIKQELEKFGSNQLLNKTQNILKRFDFGKLQDKLSTIPQFNERMEQLRQFSEEHLHIDVEKEKIFSEQFKELYTNVLLIETGNRLIMMDTGIGKKQISEKNASVKNYLSGLLTGLQYNETQTAHDQIRKLGFSPTDVTDIVISHMDMDHIGGIGDFPQATAHLYQKELESANHPQSAYDKKRFMKELWQNHKKFEVYENKGEGLFGFHLTPLKGIKEDLFLVDLWGHTPGHAGLFVRPKDYIFAGDSFIHEWQLMEDYTPVSIRLYKKMTTSDEPALNSTLDKLKALCASGIHVCCSHDKHQFEQMKDYLEEETND